MDITDLVFIGMVYEIVIIIIASILLVLIIRKYFEKRHRLTLYLFIIFLNFSIAIIFSCLSKVLVLYSGEEYVYNNTVPAPNTLLTWIILRILDFRFSFFLITIALFFSYILKVNVFEKGYNQTQKIIVIIYGSWTGFYSLIIYERGNTLLDVFAFLFLLIFMSMIYIPFMLRSIETYKSVDETFYKKAFFSLAIMSLCFMLVLFGFLIDRVFILLGSPGFTIFYFLAWSFVIVAMLGAYLGYVNPKSKEK
ncbi:MAG: hypothetical protein ACTSRI_09815 [Promethearchaeota archaeon]